jgi:hypothetical protein
VSGLGRTAVVAVRGAELSQRAIVPICAEDSSLDADLAEHPVVIVRAGNDIAVAATAVALGEREPS